MRMKGIFLWLFAFYFGYSRFCSGFSTDDPSVAVAHLPALSDSVEDVVYLNIHVKLDPESNEIILEIDSRLHALLPHDDVFLNTINEPHVTVYLTAFQASKLKKIQRAVALEISRFHVFSFELADVLVQGDYAMWEVQLCHELQFMSDCIVNATYVYAVQNQTVPEWVYDLPEPERSEKIHYVQKFGSPNVFSQFQPHVTLAWDNYTSTENITAAFAQIGLSSRSSRVDVIGVGKVGKHGTVLRGQDYVEFPLYSRDSSSNHRDIALKEAIIVISACVVCVILCGCGCMAWCSVLLVKRHGIRKQTEAGMRWLEVQTGINSKEEFSGLRFPRVEQDNNNTTKMSENQETHLLALPASGSVASFHSDFTDSDPII